MKGRRGSILILASWTLLFLSVLAVSVGAAVRQKAELVQRIESRDMLRLIAESGVHSAVSYLGLVVKADPFLAYRRVGGYADTLRDFENIRVGPGSFTVSYLDADHADRALTRYGLMDEQSRLNVNVVPAYTISRLLQEQAGLEEEAAGELAGAIVDWRDGDNERQGFHTISNEDIYYKMSRLDYIPKNADYVSIEEVLLVNGMTPWIYGRIRPYITVYGDGRININTCRRQVMRAVGMPDSLIMKILKYRDGVLEGMRRGSDGVFRSPDSVIAELEELRVLLSNERSALKAMIDGGVLAADSDIFRVTSRARIDGRPERLTVSSVVDRDGNVMYWMEDFKKDDGG